MRFSFERSEENHECSRNWHTILIPVEFWSPFSILKDSALHRTFHFTVSIWGCSDYKARAYLHISLLSVIHSRIFSQPSPPTPSPHPSRFGRGVCGWGWLSLNGQLRETERVHGFSGWRGGEESTCQCRRLKTQGFNPWVGTIPYGGGHGSPLQYFLPGEPHGRRSLAGYSP